MDLTEQVVQALVSNWALILGLVLISTWFVKTFFPQVLEPRRHRSTTPSPTPLVVQLDPEVSKAIHDTAVAIKSVSEIVERRDDSGMPLVYSDRKQETATLRIADAIKEIAEAQKRLADSMAHLDARFEAHDKSDSITFARLADTMVRIESIAQTNRESLLVFGKDHAAALKALDDIVRAHDDHDSRVMKAITLQEEIRQQLTSKTKK